MALQNCLFDRLVGGGQHCRRHIETERARPLHVDEARSTGRSAGFSSWNPPGIDASSVERISLAIEAKQRPGNDHAAIGRAKRHGTVRGKGW